MEKYQKIDTMYERYMFDANACPNKNWRKMRNNIVIGTFSDQTAKYLFDCPWEAYAKIDGTNSKIAYFPSAKEIKVEGKDENSESQKGQFEYLIELGEMIKPKLMEMYPSEMAKFVPKISKETNKPTYLKVSPFGVLDDAVEPNKNGIYGVELEEVPIYIYGEYYGEGIQKCGKRYIENGHDFAVFDIRMQGWWTPKDYRDSACKELGLKQVPFLGIMTLRDIEKMVRDGFKTTLEGVSDPTLLEEGIVARPTIPMFNSRKERVITKIKHKDYFKLDMVLNELGAEEFNDFKDWYEKNKIRI